MSAAEPVSAQPGDIALRAVDVCGLQCGEASGSVTGSYQYRMASSATYFRTTPGEHGMDSEAGVQRGTGTMYQRGEQASGGS